MISLLARDALSDQVVCMKAEARAGDLARRPNRGAVCAVFEEADDGEEQFLGLVPAEAITRNPRKAFRDLLPCDGSEPVAGHRTLPEVLKQMRIAQVEALAVTDENSRFLGVITHASIIQALLRREQELLKRSREYRAWVQEDKRRRYESVRRVEQMNHAFRKVLGLVARPPGRDLFQRGLEALSLALGASYGAVHLPEVAGPDHEGIVAGIVPGTSGAEEDFFRQRWPLVERILRENRVVLVNDVAALVRRSGGEGKQQPFVLHSFLGVPIARERQVFGCVYFCDKAGEPFTDDDEVVATSFAHGLALVLAQARESARRRRAEAERDLLSRLALDLSGADTLEKVAQIVHDVTAGHWKWEAFVFTVRRSGVAPFEDLLAVDHLPSQEGAPPQAEGSEFSSEEAVPPRRVEDRAMLDSRLLAGEAVLINRTPEDPGPRLRSFGHVERLSQSMIYAPVRVEGEVTGLITVQSYTSGRFQKADCDLLQKIADAVAPALARCQAERRSRAFSSLGFRLSTATSPGEVARIIVDTADSLLGWDAAYVYLYDASRQYTESILHVDTVGGKRTDVNPDLPCGPASPLAQRAIREGALLITRDEPRFTGDTDPYGDRTRPSMTLMVVPLRSMDRITGVLSIQSYTPRAYDARDLSLLQDLADHCSGALERARFRRLGE